MAENKCFLLIGSEDAGKTETIREWCKSRGRPLHKGLNRFETKIKDKEELIIVTSCSPQETEGFAESEKIIELLSGRLKKYQAIAEEEGFSRFIWLMAITVGVKKSEVLTDQVTKPIAFLEGEKIELTKIYLRRCKDQDNEEKFEELDDFINDLKDYQIDSEQEYKRQAKELDDLIVSNL